MAGAANTFWKAGGPPNALVVLPAAFVRFEAAGLPAFCIEEWRDVAELRLLEDHAGAITDRTAFWIEADAPCDAMIDSSSDWIVRVDRSRTPVTDEYQQMFERHDAALTTEAWKSFQAGIGDWQRAVGALQAGEEQPWTLVEDELSQRREGK